MNNNKHNIVRAGTRVILGRALSTIGPAVAMIATFGWVAFASPAAAGQPSFRAQTDPRITYPDGGTSQAEFHVASDKGVINVRNGSEPDPIFAYTVKVQCSTLVNPGPNEIVYFAGPVIESHGAIDITDDWLFAAATAGGPGVGTISGQLAPFGSCYDGTNAGLTGPAFTVTTGRIRITN